MNKINQGPIPVGYQHLTDAQFRQFSDLIYQKTGIFLKSEKKALLTSRLGKRLRTGGFGSFQEYFDFIIANKSGEEFIHLIDSVSTNFTSFYREKDHFEFLENIALPHLTSKADHRGGELAVWSAASSSGEEPYTIAMILAEFCHSHPSWRFRILATDISTRVLEKANKGIYPVDRTDKVPSHLLRKYFRKGVDNFKGYVRVKEELRRLMTFQRFNLMDPFAWNEAFDVIFCRNVMIYFNRETQQTLVDKFYKCLVPGGYLLIGHSESLTFIKHQLKQVATTVYQK